MENEILLSIFIPTYNRSKQLRQLIEFLASENIREYADVELIISNNNSTDETKDVLENYRYKIPNLYIFNKTKNTGAIDNIKGSGMNCKGRFLWIIGDDDILKPGILNLVRNVLLNNENLFWVFINHSFWYGDKCLNKSCFNGMAGYYTDGKEMLHNIAVESGLGVEMFTSANIIKKDCINKINHYVELVNESENRAIPLGYCFQAAFSGAGYIINEVFVDDQFCGNSWSNYYYQVQARDMIAICDMVGKYNNQSNFVNNLLINNLPIRFPFFYYAIFKVKYNFEYDNYALYWYLKNFKIKFISEIVLVPFIFMKKIIIKFMRRILK